MLDLDALDADELAFVLAYIDKKLTPDKVIRRKAKQYKVYNIARSGASSEAEVVTGKLNAIALCRKYKWRLSNITKA